MKTFEFLKIVDKAIKGLNEKGKKLLEELVLDIEPRSGQIPNTTSGNIILAEFKGNQKVEPNLYISRITIFQEDIEFCNRNSSRKDLIFHITNIIAHELMHYLGANELYANRFRNKFIEVFKEDSFKKESWWAKLKRSL